MGPPNYFRKFGIQAILSVLFLATFALQSYNVGFPSGHYGWVSAHNLANLSHSSRANLFVGYTYKEVVVAESGEESLNFEYFFRNPFVGNAVLATIIRCCGLTLPEQVIVSRQAMNLVTSLSLWFSFLICLRILGDPFKALAVAVFVFSSYYMVRYGDHVAPENLSLLGNLILIHALMRFEADGKKRPLWITAFASLSIGWGFNAAIVLVIWASYDAIATMKSKRPLLSAAKSVMTSHASRLAIFGCVLSALYVGYSVAVEAHLTDLPIAKTSIVESARKRLVGSQTFDVKYDEDLAWGIYSADQFDRFKRTIVPYGLDNRVAAWVMIALVITALGAYWRHASNASPSQRLGLFLMGASTIVWLILMRRLVAFHDYAAVALSSLTVSVLCLVLWRVPSRFGPALVGLATVIFFKAQLDDFRDKDREAVQRNVITYDFDAMRGFLKDGDRVAFEKGYREVTPGAPYAPGFYLRDQLFAPASVADFIVSRNPNCRPISLTPSNQAFFLFVNDKAAPGCKAH